MARFLLMLIDARMYWNLSERYFNYRLVSGLPIIETQFTVEITTSKREDLPSKVLR